VINAFLWLSSLIHSVKSKTGIDNVFIEIPEDLWRDLFTPQETAHLLRAREKTLMDDRKVRFMTVMDEWEGKDDFPEAPETMEEVTAARTVEQRMHRIR